MEKLAEAYYQYDQDPSLRAAILFGHGENFSRGIDVEGFRSLVGTGKPWIASTGTIHPLAKRAPRLTKPVDVVSHGDTWNMAHELFLVADIRIASSDTRFGQDENTHRTDDSIFLQITLNTGRSVELKEGFYKELTPASIGQ